MTLIHAAHTLHQEDRDLTGTIKEREKLCVYGLIITLSNHVFRRLLPHSENTCYKSTHLLQQQSKCYGGRDGGGRFQTGLSVGCLVAQTQTTTWMVKVAALRWTYLYHVLIGPIKSVTSAFGFCLSDSLLQFSCLTKALICRCCGFLISLFRFSPLCVGRLSAVTTVLHRTGVNKTAWFTESPSRWYY